MKWLVFIVMAVLVFPQFAFPNAWAQSEAQVIDNSKLDVVEEPICFALRNYADYTVAGNIATAQFVRPDGIVARHRSNFRLYAAGSTNDAGELSDREEFCSYGPFLPDRQLSLTLRTLFPVFDCDTRIDQGEIAIYGERRADDSGVQTWAECYAADGTPSGRPDN